MPQSTPTQSFGPLGQSPYLPVPAADGAALARLILRSEVQTVAYEQVRAIEGLTDPPATIRHIHNAAPPLRAPEGGTSAEAVRDMMKQLAVIEEGANTRLIQWGTERDPASMGELRLHRNNVNASDFAGQAIAVRRLQENMHTLAGTLVSPAYINPLSSMSVDGREDATRQYLGQAFTQAVSQYQNELGQAGGRPAGNTVAIGYREGTQPQSPIGERVWQITTQVDALLDGIPRGAPPAKPTLKDPAIR